MNKIPGRGFLMGYIYYPPASMVYIHGRKIVCNPNALRLLTKQIIRIDNIKFRAFNEVFFVKLRLIIFIQPL